MYSGSRRYLFTFRSPALIIRILVGICTCNIIIYWYFGCGNTHVIYTILLLVPYDVYFVFCCVYLAAILATCILYTRIAYNAEKSGFGARVRHPFVIQNPLAFSEGRSINAKQTRACIILFF